MGMDSSFGAEVVGGSTRFAVLADAGRVSVRLYAADGASSRDHELRQLGDAHFEAVVEGVGHGALYNFVVNGRELPDPYARYLPRGVHGPAMVIEPRYAFRNPRLRRPPHEHVIYELHVGTFTEAGTYRSAAERLPELSALGVTTLELMPLATFAGRHGWGYDGVALYAPHAAYGTPDELRAFVDRAHDLGLSVLLDVVYNHFGPAGNYLSAYSKRYFNPAHRTPWGDAPDFAHAPMRRYMLDNARYWLEQFRFDGLRLDATHALFDPSPTHVLAELASSLSNLEPRPWLSAEDERNDPTLVTRTGFDALWADDFHHQVHVTATGERDGYYAAYAPGATDLARCIRQGWLYQGEHSPATKAPRGAPAGALEASAFVYCIQNHDQIGNRALGERIHHLIEPAVYLAMSLLLLSLPMTPLLFMGQEWAASSPFLYFTDHDEELGRLVREGRRAEFAHFGAFGEPAAAAEVPDPQAEETFRRSQLNWNERTAPVHARTLELYRAALALRKNDPVLADPSRERLQAEAHDTWLMVRRWSSADVRLILVNFGHEPVSLSSLPMAAELSRAKLLLATEPADDSSCLAPRSAAIFAVTQGVES
jgi:maltooligosyltrehalose trehalohydrolase